MFSESFLLDESGQSSSEYILLFGAIVVIAILALIIYRSYFQRSRLNSAQDTGEVRCSTDSGSASENPPTNNTSGPGPEPEPIPPSFP
jgi:uncharacterized protein (UPF0333 family)